MVKRLEIDGVYPLVMDLGARVVPVYPYHRPIDLKFLAHSWENLVRAGLGKTYAAFTGDRADSALFGMVVPDLLTGQKQGIVYLWISVPGQGRKPVSLLRRFEADCKSDGCEVVLSCCSTAFDPARQGKLYSALGYKPYGASFSKGL